MRTSRLVPLTIPSRISPHLYLNEVLSDADLVGSRLCSAANDTLAYILENGGVGLTKSGAFSRGFVIRAVDQFQWPRYTAAELAVVNKVLNEDDVLPIAILHQILRAAKLIRQMKGKAVLTSLGKLLVGSSGRVQVVLFETYFTRFDFAAFERWPVEIPDADTFHFLGVVRNRLGDWVAFPKFAGWCLPIDALPGQHGNPKEDAMFYLATRLVRPLVWLGLLEQDEPSRLAPLDAVRLKKTPLFDRFSEVRYPAIWLSCDPLTGCALRVSRPRDPRRGSLPAAPGAALSFLRLRPPDPSCRSLTERSASR